MDFRSILRNIVQKPYFLPLVFAVGMGWRFYISRHGVSNIDVGWIMSFHDTILQYPDSLMFNYVVYLTGLIGGCWNALFPETGVYGSRIVDACFNGLTVAAMCYTVKELTPNRKWMALAAGVSLCFPMFTFAIHYNTLSYCLFSVALCLIVKSVTFPCNNPSLASASHINNFTLFFAGLIIGICFSVRFTNLTLVSLLIIPAILRRWRSLLCMMVGMMLGLSLILTLAFSLGHLDNIAGAFTAATAIVSNTESADTHNGFSMILHYIYNYMLDILPHVLILLFGYWLYRFKKFRALIIVGIAVLSYTNNVRLTLASVCLWVIIYTLWLKWRSCKNKGFIAHLQDLCSDRKTLICVLSLIGAVCIPVGSDCGMQAVNQWGASIMVLPACCIAIHCVSPALRQYLAVVFIIIGGTAFTHTLLRADGSHDTRFELTEVIQPNRLNVKVNAHDAIIFHHAIETIQSVGNDYDPLLLTNPDGEFYYATKRLPFLRHTETRFFTLQALKAQLDLQTQWFGRCPVIADIKGLTDPEPGVEDIIKEYIDSHDYYVAQSDSIITLYVPH